MNYWQITKWDKETIKIKPEYVEIIKAKLESGEGFIETANGIISVKDIKEFSETDKPYSNQRLIEDSARAFNEPVMNENGDVVVKWVKKSVPRREYEKFHQYNPSYRKLGEQDKYVMVGFRLPVHQIKPDLHQELTPSEILDL